MTLSGVQPSTGQTVSDRIDESRLKFWCLALLFLVTLLVFLRLQDRALWGPEGRWAEITREMQLTRNYFWPTINGVDYYDKPLVSYWLIAGVASVTGTLDEFAVRLPSAVGGFFGVVLLGLLARRLYDLRTAVIAGFILATSFSYALFSRTASADIETVSGVLGALALFAYNEKRQRGWWVVPFWLTMAVTSLVKGLEGFALPLLVVGSYSIFAQGWEELRRGLWEGKGVERLGWLADRCGWLIQWRTLPALLAALTLYFLPFVISYAETRSNVGLYKVFNENVTRFLSPFDHREPFYFYLYRIFSLAAPWSLFLPAALLQIYSKARGRSDRFILAYFWAIFIFFNLSASRRDYYLLPLLPAAAVLIARLFVTAPEALDRRARKLMEAGYLLIAVPMVVAGLLALLPPALRPGPLSGLPLLPDRLVFAALWVIMLASVAFALVRLRPERIVVSSGVLAYLGLLFLFVFMFPGAERYRGERGFAQTVRAQLGGDLSRVLLYRSGGAGLLFYLAAQRPLTYCDRGGELTRLVEDDPDRWIIAPERELLDLRLRGSVMAREETQRWDRGESPHGPLVLFRPDSSARVREKDEISP